MHCIRKSTLLAGLLAFASPALATITVSSWAPRYKGVDFATGTADASESRIQKVFTMRVDLSEPSIEFFSTPSNGDEPLETTGQTTTTFVKTYGVSLAVNANFFSPVTTIPDDPRELSGLAISRGAVVSTHQNSYPPALITRNNQVSFVNTPPSDLSSIYTAVSGSDLILVNGVPQLSTCTTSFCLENPRTALGLSQDGRYLYMMVIDGRQTSWSMGATLYETAQWLMRFGAWNGVNLDGGGSSAMAVATNGTAVLVNKPSGGVQRVDGNHLGVFAVSLDTSVWNGGGVNDYWNNAANWNNYLPAPGASCDLQFGGTRRLAPINDFLSSSSFRHITFRGEAGAFTLSGNPIILNGNLTNNSATLQTIKLPISTTAVRTVACASGVLTLGGPVSGAGGGLNIVGPGVVFLSTNNTYTGSTTVGGGVLVFSGSLTNSAGAMTVDGGTLTAVGRINTGTGAWNAGSTASSKGIINLGAGSAVQVAGTFVLGASSSGGGALNITGGGLTNTHSSASSNLEIGAAGYGVLKMSAGNVQVNTFYVGGDSGIGLAAISGGTFLAGQPGAADYLLVGGVRSGTGVLTVSGGLLNHANVNRLISVNNNSDGRGELNLFGGTIDNSGGGLGYGYNSGTGTGSGIVNINAGNLILNRFVNTKQVGTTLTGDSHLNFNGGTLKASLSTLTSPSLALSSNFIPSRIDVRVNGAFGSFPGGAVIDTAGQDCVVEAPLLAPTGNGISSLAVASGGSGYIGAPYVSISGDGSGATAIANMVDDGTGKGTLRVSTITISNPGVDYTESGFSFVGGSPVVEATPGALTTTTNRSGGLTKNGAGTLTLMGTNTYTGATIVNSGTLQIDGSLAPASSVTVAGGVLGGVGLIGGPVTVRAGGALAPMGSLTISNTLTLEQGSSTLVRITAGSGSSDLVRGITSANYGGTLVVSNISGALMPGQKFQIFSAGQYNGNFSSIQSPGSGVVLSFNPALGMLSVASATPTNITWQSSGPTFTLSWPDSHQGWFLQSNSVSVADTNAWFDIPGSEATSSMNITSSLSGSNVFYRLRYPQP